ncbi:MAG: fibronectin type III domain-containing protein [Nitrospinae bacterium]|nr:fibronectin type III domain-containing protein [Nitrospinota bacterium]
MIKIGHQYCLTIILLILIPLFTIGGCASEDGGSSGGGGEGGNGSITLAWDAPTTNEDETCLQDLKGYRIYYGISSENYSETIDIDVGNICKDTGEQGCDTINKKTCTYTVQGLKPGTWYFAVKAYDTSENESGYSNEVSTDI